MSKVNKNNDAVSSLKNLPSILIAKKAFGLLRNEYRKKLYGELNKQVLPTMKDNTWKCRFLYPEKHLKRSVSNTVPIIMEEMLMLKLQEQVFYDTESIQEANVIIETYKNEQI